MVIRAVCVLKGDVNGTVYFDQRDEKSPVVLSGEVDGLAKGKHGFHIHEFGDSSNGCTSAGAHYNPKKLDHGSPDADIRHVGDLGNIESHGGVTKVCMQDSQISLVGPHSIIGRTLTLAAMADDLGIGGHELSKVTGNTGEVIACGIIGRAFSPATDTKVYVQDEQISLTGPQSIIGRSLVVHADADDLGLGGHELSKTTGNAGGRIACGIIGIAKSA